MKYKLMIQSLSPLALLTMIKNFNFVTIDSAGVKLDFSSFILANIQLIIVQSFCLLWIFLGLMFILSFNAFKYSDRKGGYSVSIVNKKEGDSLNFFLTLILPLLIDNINTWQGMLLFFTILFLIWGLLSNTNLYYANPVLSLFGYRIFEIEFPMNKEKEGKRYVALSRGDIDVNHNVEYKEISDEVLFLKGMNK